MLVEAKIKKATKEGMEKAMIQFMNDSIEEVPKCPEETGALAASHSVFVNGKFLKAYNNPVSGNGKATPRMIPFLNPRAGIIEGILVAHKPYAASQHEGFRKGVIYRKYTKPQSGSKWILSKLLRNGNRYMSIIGRRIKSS